MMKTHNTLIKSVLGAAILGLWLAVSSGATAHPIDVTAKVREAVKDHVLSIAVNNSTFVVARRYRVVKGTRCRVQTWQ